MSADGLYSELADSFIGVSDGDAIYLLYASIFQSPRDIDGKIALSYGAIGDRHVAGIDHVVAEVKM